MKIEFIFNSVTSLKLTPETSRDKQLIALYMEGAQSIKIVAAGRGNPEALVIEVCTIPPNTTVAVAEIVAETPKEI